MHFLEDMFFMPLKAIKARFEEADWKQIILGSNNHVSKR